MKKIQQPTKEEIINYYITDNHSTDDCLQHFNVSHTTFIRWLRKYDIYKTKEQMSQTRLDKQKDIGYSTAILEKRRQTCLKKYGVDCVSKSQAIKEKTKDTCLKKYGVECVLNSQDIQEKIKSTCLENYGVDNPLKSKALQKKAKETIVNRYGVYNFNKKDIKNLDIWEDKDKFTKLIQSFKQKPTVRDLMDYFNVSDVSVGTKVRQFNLEKKVNFKPSVSRYEQEIIQVIKDLGITNIVQSERQILSGQEIDIYLPDYRFGIEFNGDYWHSDIFHVDHSGRSLYHQNKSLAAEKNNVFLFHIFEHEWNNAVTRENIINRIKTILVKNSIKVPARKCKIVALTKQQKSNFLNQNHIQGNDRSSVCYGLVFGDDIVACMTFVHPKNNKYTWELSRFCSKHGYVVQGGASKLFKFFVDQIQTNDTISSYNDITKTKGDLYETLGFECKSINSPNYVWINFNTGDIRTRYQEQKSGEIKRMHDKGYHRVCDCGTKTWVYTKK